MSLAPTLNADPLFIAVWGRSPLGECLCPSGVQSEALDGGKAGGSGGVRVGTPGTCKKGKHPTPEFPHGLRDAVPWPDLARLTRPGGRPAAVLGSGVWVLDVDGPRAWRGLVRLAVSGALDFEQVRAVCRTPRGEHVWVECEDTGWTTGKAQREVNRVLDALGAGRGLEVKSQGGYVLWPDGVGDERVWLDPGTWALKVAWSAQLLAPRLRTVWEGVKLGRGPSPEEYDGNSQGTGGAGWTPEKMAEFPPECFGMTEEEAQGWGAWSSEDLARLRAVRWEQLQAACAVLRTRAEGDRNNMLNRIGWIEGRRAVEAGCGAAEVSGVLRAAGVAAGLSASEVGATVRSALHGAGTGAAGTEA